MTWAQIHNKKNDKIMVTIVYRHRKPSTIEWQVTEISPLQLNNISPSPLQWCSLSGFPWLDISEMTHRLSHQPHYKNKNRNHRKINEKKKNSGNSKENNRSLSNITHSKRCIIIIPSHIPCSGLFFDSQRNINFLQGNPTTPFTLHFQCNKKIVKIQNNISFKSKQYTIFIWKK